jgi:quercetin dioxygenase-like cupin family protein
MDGRRWFATSRLSTLNNLPDYSTDSRFDRTDDTLAPLACAIIAVIMKVERWETTESPDARALQRRMESEGYRVFQWSDEPGAVYGRHSHPEHQSHWIVSGTLELQIGDETYTLSAGDRDYMPANTEHSAIVPGKEKVVYLIGAKS